MYNANKPDASELPSTGKLLKSTGIAVAVASALLVTVVIAREERYLQGVFGPDYRDYCRRVNRWL